MTNWEVLAKILSSKDVNELNITTGIEQFVLQEASKIRFLLDAFDAADNSICIYDKDANLLYGNNCYFKSMHIQNRDSAIGMNILDIAKQSKIKIHSTKTDSNRPKMLDVLKNGKKLLDWEVTITDISSSNNVQMISYNMYPIKDPDGNVAGMIEIATSQQLNLTTTKKMMGLTAEYTFDSIVGNSPQIKSVIKQAKEYAKSPYSLLIVGESGVGKELFSQAVHNYSDRSRGPFVAINCANFPENLIESELFGYVGGAFTGASKNGQIGKFELADGGTIFLDEIGELPFHFQSKLLRVLETHTVTRIGSTSPTPVNVRVIAATNRDLEKMIDEGLFRKDLYYRLQVLNIEIPPLRERPGDILALAHAFFIQAAEISGDAIRTLSPDAEKCLTSYNWPGNIRELKNVIQRVALLSKTPVVSKETLETAIWSKGFAFRSESSSPASEDTSSEGRPSEETGHSPLPTVSPSSDDMISLDDLSPDEILSKRFEAVDSAYRMLLKDALKITCGNKKKAAELLGVSRQTIYRMLEKYIGSDSDPGSSSPQD